MLVDLKDAYLTLGLHPSHRKYCHFRHPQTGRRMQWRTVSFGIAEAPRLCTKLLRPLMAILKQLFVSLVSCLVFHFSFSSPVVYPGSLGWLSLG